MVQIKILSVNISEKKGTEKLPVDNIELNEMGIVNDAHAGNWHRQVSLLGNESIEKFNADTAAISGSYPQKTSAKNISYGKFAENITTQGFPLYKMNPLDRLVSGKVVLEVTQIGKKCHGGNCAVFKETGDCVMPKEGIFCRVLHGGMLRAGDILEYRPKTLRFKVITVSDRASSGEYPDKSGPLLQEAIYHYFTANNQNVSAELAVVPDEIPIISKMVKDCVNNHIDVVFTCGGTGIGPRDVTPEALKPMLDREMPGIVEYIRVKYGTENPNALTSRAIAGVSGKTLIFALPGSPKAVNEYSGEIFKTILHSVKMLHGLDSHS
ncbi:MAG: hypothetical protein JXB34_07555 [Bacteroidales bacterium]|nr:hypothetical protein [Bacteroidales bacterium]